MSEDLLKWRSEFPGVEGCVYMVSHSLGCMPLKAAEYMNTFMEEWHQKSITAWDIWLPEVDSAAGRIEKLLSAPKGTVMMQTNVSMCMSILASCFDFTKERNKVVYTDMQLSLIHI